MMRIVPAVQQHCKIPASALVSALTHPGTTAPAAHLAPVTAATWGHMHNRLPVGFPLPATYSSGAGSSDAIPPSNLPSGALSSEASAIDAAAIDSMPEDAFPAGANRTPGPSETMNVDKMRESDDFPTSDQATKEGRTAAADPYGPNDASSKVNLPPEPQQEPLYPPTQEAGSVEAQEEPPHPKLPPKDGSSTHMA